MLAEDTGLLSQRQRTVTHGWSRSQSFTFPPVPCVPGGGTGALDRCLCVWWFVLQERNSVSGDPLLLWGTVTSLLFVWGETLPHFSRLRTADTTLRNGLVKSRHCTLQNPARTCRDAQHLWRIACTDDDYSRNTKRWEELRVGKGVEGVKQCWPVEID